MIIDNTIRLLNGSDIVDIVYVVGRDGYGKYITENENGERYLVWDIEVLSLKSYAMSWKRICHE